MFFYERISSTYIFPFKPMSCLNDMCIIFTVSYVQFLDVIHHFIDVTFDFFEIWKLLLKLFYSCQN